MYIFKYLHIITMFIAVALSVGPELVLHRVAQTGDVRAIRAAFGAAKPLGQLVPILFVVGLVFGLIATALGQFNFLAPWLIIAYVIFIIAMGIGSAVIGPWQQKVGMASAKNGDGTPSGELSALLSDRMITYAMWINLALVVLIVFVMVLKPLG